MNEEIVRRHIWPHMDYGSKQITHSDPERQHGDVCTTTWERDGKVLKKTVGSFRLIDKELDPQFIKTALPIAKKIWEEEGKEWPFYEKGSL